MTTGGRAARAEGHRARIESLDDLRRLPPRGLDALFRRSPAGAVPDGEAQGVGLVLAGARIPRPLARGLRLAWRGKLFDRRGGTMVNRVTPLGLRAVPARVHEGTSRLDARPCIVLDYAGASRLAGMVRDELREVAPGLYLGVAFWGRVRLFTFALRFEPGPPA